MCKFINKKVIVSNNTYFAAGTFVQLSEPVTHDGKKVNAVKITPELMTALASLSKGMFF